MHMAIAQNGKEGVRRRHIWLPWNEWFRLTNALAIVVLVITVGCRRWLSKGSCLCYTHLMCNPVKVSDVYIPTKCLGLCYWWTFLPRKPKQINLPSYWPIEGLNKIHKRDHEVWATENGGFIYNFITEAVCCRSQIILNHFRLTLAYSPTESNTHGDFP